jgi:hypothetical protein
MTRPVTPREVPTPAGGVVVANTGGLDNRGIPEPVAAALTRRLQACASSGERIAESDWLTRSGSTGMCWPVVCAAA